MDKEHVKGAADKETISRITDAPEAERARLLVFDLNNAFGFETWWRYRVAFDLEGRHLDSELGYDARGRLLLADEVLTPDSSRFWPAAEWQPGRPQRSLDKQFLRDWSAGLDWDRRPPGPAIPDDVVAATQARYTELFTRVTGRE